jgi:hypothetical protein
MWALKSDEEDKEDEGDKEEKKDKGDKGKFLHLPQYSLRSLPSTPRFHIIMCGYP